MLSVGLAHEDSWHYFWGTKCSPLVQRIITCLYSLPVFSLPFGGCCRLPFPLRTRIAVFHAWLPWPSAEGGLCPSGAGQAAPSLPCPSPPTPLSPREPLWAGDQSGGEKQAGPPLAVAGSSWMSPSCGSKAPQVKRAVCERAVSFPNRHVSPDICCLGCTFVGGPSSGPAVPALFMKHGTRWVPSSRISGDAPTSPEPPS